MPLLLALLLIPLLVIVLMPVALLQRIRRGTMRRQARSWVITANLAAVLLSTATFLVGALLMSRWVPDAFPYSLAGFGAGAVLGLLGLALTRWERHVRTMFYTPNRWLVLAITLIVAGRVLYGFWRTWAAWRAGLPHVTAVVESGVAMSMGAGSIVLGYYAIYWLGIRRRLRVVS